MWVCRLPVHIDPAGCTGFYGNLRRIRNFPSGRQSRRPLRRDCTSAYLVGADDSVRPRDVPILRESSANSQLPHGPKMGIGPYRTPANPYCFANFERKAFLPQPFKGSCY